MQDQSKIIECYNAVAKNYAAKYLDELNYKHFDRILLSSFVVENIYNGTLIDLGCGPGQTTKYLSDLGCTDLLGVDISPGMVDIARSGHPMLNFETADILRLQFSDSSFGSAIAFYAIVHFNYEQLTIAFQEIKRILKNDGQFLFSFHIGDQLVHLDSFLDNQVNIDFYFFEIHKIVDILRAANFEIMDIMERHSYPDIEYPSKRAYIWVKNKK